jgi:hypothetical protein
MILLYLLKHLRDKALNLRLSPGAVENAKINYPQRSQPALAIASEELGIHLLNN